MMTLFLSNCSLHSIELSRFLRFVFCLISNLVFLHVLTLFVIAGEPDLTPRFRVEPGVHFSQIWRIDVDKSEKFVVSSSGDKTARIWDVRTGELLQVLRPPIGEGGEGRLYSVAFHPDGSKVALAGSTGYAWDNSYCIYIFDRESGQIQSRIPGLPDVVTHLAYSLDGKRLGVSLGAGEGVRFYKVSAGTVPYQEIARDDDYGAASYSIAFDSLGRSVTSCNDGFIRLYDETNTKIKEFEFAGKEPFFADFSPDNRRIAVGFFYVTDIRLLSADHLEPVESPDTTGYDNGCFNTVAWSLDSLLLYAGGIYSDGDGSPIIAWSTRSFSKPQTFRTAQYTVMGIIPLSDGSILFASQDPAIGRLSVEGNVIWKHGSGQLDFRGKIRRRNFKISDDGEQISFQFIDDQTKGAMYRGHATWDTATLKLIRDEDGLAQLSPPLFSVPEMTIEDWESNFYPKLNGKKLELRDYEFSRSLAITRIKKNNKHFFALGADWYLRLYDEAGNLQWSEHAPVGWAVNISKDNRYVVAALKDGTIRWYQFKDGRERLALYIHPKSTLANPLWIAWTPEGFYATSSKEEKNYMYLGVHFNEGADSAARFIEAGQLSEVFVREDLVAHALTDEYHTLAAKALEDAGDLGKILAAGSAPAIHLVGEDSVALPHRNYTLQFELEDLGGGIGKLEYRVNGKLMSSGSSRPYGPRKAGSQKGMKRKFTLSPGENIISVTAYNRKNQLASKPVEISVQVDDPVFREPSLYVISIGISKYHDSSIGLDYAADDAIDFAALLKKRGKNLYKRVTPKVLVDQEATLNDIGLAFEEIAKKAQPQDVFVLYLAGHGMVNDGRYHFIPHGLIYENPASLKNALDEEKLKELVASVETEKRLMFIDSCYSGKAIGSLSGLSPGKSRNMADKAAIGRLMNATGIAILAATAADQEAKEGVFGNDEGHGLLTHVILEALRGKADGRVHKDNQIDVEEIISYARTEVPRISMEKWKQEQFPMYQAPRQNFPIAIIRK